MIIKLKIQKIDVLISDGNILCSDEMLLDYIKKIIDLEGHGLPQSGYYDFLKLYFNNVEVVNIEENEQITY